MSMWYAFAGVLILKDSVSPTFTLIAVANPWMVWSPAPFTCQSAGGSPGFVFSHAITLITGGPHGPAAVADGVLTPESKAINTATIDPITKARDGVRPARGPVPSMCAPPCQ